MRGDNAYLRLTRTELLLALLILAVLSSLLLPALTQRAASARQAVCLANVRNVALALRMYLTDHDYAFPPRETDASTIAYFNRFPGRGDVLPWEEVPKDGSAYCHRSSQANPYLRWPVVLDDYVLTREVWRCPSARLQQGASFINGAGPRWAENLRAHEGEWGKDTGFCPMVSWPLGWGGEVTDTLAQRRLAVPRTAKGRTASPGMFLQSIGVNTSAAELETALAVDDPSWYVVCADGGATIDDFCTGTLAYPDLCRLECAGPGNWEADWENCSWSKQCGAKAVLKTSPEMRRPYARHYGGVNIGFLDGHAAWFDSEIVIAESPSTGDPNRGRLRGYHPWAPTSDAAGGSTSGVLPLY